VVRTPASHVGNAGSTPAGVTKQSLDLIEEISSLSHADRSKASRLLRRLEQVGEEIRRQGGRDSILVFNRILVILGLPGADSGAPWRELGLGQMSGLLTDFDHVARRAAPATLYKAQAGDRAVEAHVRVMRVERRTKRGCSTSPSRGQRSYWLQAGSRIIARSAPPSPGLVDQKMVQFDASSGSS
jgi:hypothetical protein